MTDFEMDKEIKRVESAWKNGCAVSTRTEVVKEMVRRWAEYTDLTSKLRNEIYKNNAERLKILKRRDELYNLLHEAVLS